MIRVSCRLAFGAFVALAATACANATQAGDRSAPTAAPHDRTVLYGDELHAGSDHYLYDVIQRARPEWLRVHGSTSIATGLSGNTDPDVIHVYVGVVRVGGPEILTRLPTANADTLRYFTPAQAQARFGVGNPNGVIQVLSAVPPPPPE